MSVRVRFAPSPTGMLHVGALRDALFKFLFARHSGGANILRIEDTDRNRYDPESEAEFVKTLSWVGIEFDEGPHVGGPHEPYRQSQRKEAGIYQVFIQQLLDQGDAYKAFDTPEELTAMRDAQQEAKQNVGYFGGKWRDASAEDVLQAEQKGLPYVIRLKIPRGQKISVEDAIRGKIEWDSDTVDDPVLIKGDGMPTYHFAAMVDDHLMGITHIMRGEEWISSAPKHAVLFDKFGWTRPVFVHCPVIVGNDGKKLSKRHGATRVLDYMAEGYLPLALKNFVALIGWSPGGDKEAMSEEELIEAFTLEGLQPSPGKFDLEKLRWLNGHHIRQMPIPELLAAFMAYAQEPYVETYWQQTDGGDRVLRNVTELASYAVKNRDYVLRCFELTQERVVLLPDFGEACRFFIVDDLEYDPKAVAKWFTQPHVDHMFDQFIAQAGEFVTPEGCEKVLKGYAEEQGFEKLGPVVHPTRVALTGKTAGPGLFELMAVLGPDRIRTRLAKAKPFLDRPA